MCSGLSVHAQATHSVGGVPTTVVKNEQASVAYKMDLVRQYWMEHLFLQAALLTRPADQRLKSTAKFVSFQHKLASHRLAIDLAAYSFNQKTPLLDHFFNRLNSGTPSDLDWVAYGGVLNELYVQADLSPESLLALRQARDKSQVYTTLFQTADLIKLTEAPVFKDMNLAELVQRWGRAEQAFARIPNSQALIQTYAALDLSVPPRTVVLTFDDGPNLIHTPQILDVLKRHKIKAMFFQLGSIFDGDYFGAENVKASQAIQQRLLKDGHVVANHTYSHPKLSTLAPEAARTQITSAQRLIHAASGRSAPVTQFFRPPYGDTDDNTLLAIEDAHLYPLFWNIDSRDWEAKTTQQLVERTVKVADAMDGGIILLHDIHAITAQSLSDLIEALRAQRFGFSIWNGRAFVRQPD